MADATAIPTLGDDAAEGILGSNLGRKPGAAYPYLSPMIGTLPARVPVAGNAAPIAPDLAPMNASAPAPAIPGASGIPSLSMPTRAQSNAAGKTEYQEQRPQITAAPGTPEFDKEQLAQEQFDHAHPWGSDVSAHPGTLGKIAHGLATAGNIAGDILAPGTMANIPGTELNKQRQYATHLQNLGTDTETEVRQAQADASEYGNEEVPFMNPQTGETSMVSRKSLPALESAEMRAGATTGAAQIKADASTSNAGTNAATRMAALGFDKDGQPLPDDKLSPIQKTNRDFVRSKQNLDDARAELEKAKDNPDSPIFKQAQARLDAAARDYQLRLQAEQLHTAEFANKQDEQNFLKPSGNEQSRGGAAESALALIPGIEADIKAHAKDFGPIIGRIEKGEIAIGNAPPEVQKFYSELQSFYALQPSVHGFRNAEFVKDFDTFVGNLMTKPDSLIAGLEGLRPTLESVSRTGRTFKRRIKEGEAAPAAAAPGPPAAPAAPAGGAAPKKVMTPAEYLASQKK